MSSRPTQSSSDPSPSPPPYGTSAREQSTPPLPAMIAVMGATGSGKSSFINLASGSNLRVGKDLDSCTAEVQLGDPFTLDERRIVLIDTPGFDDTTKSDTDILQLIAAFLATTYERGCKLSGVIYIHRISDKRFTGIAGRNFRMFRELCGDSTLKNVALVTNMWSEVSPKDGQDRESTLSSRFFKPAIDKGARMVRHHNTAQSAHDIIRKIVENHPIALQIQREVVDEHKDIVNTAAGEVVNGELNELIRKYDAELKKLREDMEQASKKRDEELRRELEEDSRVMQKQMEKAKKDSEEMASGFAAEKVRLEGKIGRMMEKIKELQALAGTLVEIPIYFASYGDKQIDKICGYRSTYRVSGVRRELIEHANSNGLPSHIYVEVVLHGKTEGNFLEDSQVRHRETIGDISKLVYWTNDDIDHVASEIVSKVAKKVSHAGAGKRLGILSEAAVGITSELLSACSIVTTGLTSLAGKPMYHQRLLSARNTRDSLAGSSNGFRHSAATAASSVLSNSRRFTKAVFSS